MHIIDILNYLGPWLWLLGRYQPKIGRTYPIWRVGSPRAASRGWKNNPLPPCSWCCCCCCCWTSGCGSPCSHACCQITWLLSSSCTSQNNYSNGKHPYCLNPMWLTIMCISIFKFQEVSEETEKLNRLFLQSVVLFPESFSYDTWHNC